MSFAPAAVQLVPTAFTGQVSRSVVELVVVEGYTAGQHPLAPGALPAVPKFPVGLYIGDVVVVVVVVVIITVIVIVTGTFPPAAV